MRNLLFILVLLCQAKVFGQRFDFASDTLHAIWGKENLSNKADLSAKVKVNSHGDKIVLEVDVVDEKNMIKTASDQSDHIELWLALPLEEHLPSDVSEARSNSPCYFFQFDTTNKENKRYRFFTITANAGLSDLPKQKAAVYYGIVHYGLFSDNRPVEMYEKENYELLSKALGEKIGHVHQGIKYKAEPTKTGIKYTVTITPLGLGFVKVPQINKELMRLDIIDVDAQKESVLSTSKLGGAFSYDDITEIKFSKPFRTNVTTVPDFIFDSLKFAPTVMFTEKGYWSGIDKTETCFNIDDCSTKETAFMRTPFGYKKSKLGNKEIIKFTRHSKEFDSGKAFDLTLTTEEIYFVNKERYTSYRNDEKHIWEFRDFKKEFLFPDGSQGFALINVLKGKDSDSCGGFYKSLKIVKIRENKSEALFEMIFDECKETNLIGEQEAGDVIVTNVKWIKEGELFQIICERLDNHQPKKYRVEFLKNSKAKVVEEKERNPVKRK